MKLDPAGVVVAVARSGGPQKRSACAGGRVRHRAARRTLKSWLSSCREGGGHRGLKAAGSSRPGSGCGWQCGAGSACGWLLALNARVWLEVEVNFAKVRSSGGWVGARNGLFWVAAQEAGWFLPCPSSKQVLCGALKMLDSKPWCF